MAFEGDRTSIRITDGVFSIIEKTVGSKLRLAETEAAARTALLLDGNLGVRSRLHNSNFPINQRGVTGTVTLAANAFGHDRWKAGSGGCTYTFTKTNGIVVINITAGTLRQVIEGIHLPEAGPYTLAWEGTAPARIVQSGVPVADYGTLVRTGVLVSEVNASVEFGIGTLWLPRFVPGSVAALYEHREFAEELRRCQRYAQVIRDKQNVGGPARNGSSVVTSFQLPVEMRATPTLSILVAGDWWVTDGYSNDWQANPVSLVFQSLTTGGGTIALDGFTTPSNLFNGRFHLPSANQGTARLLLSADI